MVGSDPTRGMHIYPRFVCVYVVLCVGSGLATWLIPVQGVPIWSIVSVSFLRETDQRRSSGTRKMFTWKSTDLYSRSLLSVAAQLGATWRHRECNYTLTSPHKIAIRGHTHLVPNVRHSWRVQLPQERSTLSCCCHLRLIQDFGICTLRPHLALFVHSNHGNARAFPSTYNTCIAACSNNS
jgi:hypothetical protein